MERPHYHGHRKRLRERFLKNGLAGFAEHEVIELLLTLAIPRADVKQPAKALLKRFGSLRGVLDAPLSELRSVVGVGEVAAVALHVIRESATLYLQEASESSEVLHDPKRLGDFWRMRIGALRHEVFAVAYLDSAYRLLRNGVETLQEGTIDRAAVYPRRVVEAALRRQAAALVLAHNHPNGNLEPSEHDKVLTRHRHRTKLGHNYETLDELTQLLFIFEHFDEIVGPPDNDLFLARWKTRWTAIEGARGYFDKITEELVDPCRLAASGDPFIAAVGTACQRYEQALLNANRVDFAHLQRLVYDMLDDPAHTDALPIGSRYLLVDEYQDTNHIQEQLLLKLAGTDRNLCVVGDEDQSLYRFRGATVRNILEFPQRVAGCTIIKLTTNFRSHRRIVERYDRWMASADWSGREGGSFRYDKTIAADPKAADPKGEYPDYPAILSIWGRSRRDEAERFADLVSLWHSRGRRRSWCSPRTSNPEITLRPSGRGFHSGPTSGRSCLRPNVSSRTSACRSRRRTASPATSESMRPARASISSSACTTSRLRAQR